MESNKKFYEEKFSERALPNNKGQFLCGSRFKNQDWYGNPLVLHTEKTYSGEKISNLNTSDLENNPKTIFDFADNQITQFLKRLQMLVPQVQLNLENIKIIIERKYAHSYEDDGNTQTEGFDYKIHWILPLSDRNSCLESAVLNDYAVDCIVFKLSFNERLHDSYVYSRFFSMFFYGLLRENEEHQKVNCRIDYNNDNMSLNSIITVENLVRLGEKLIDYKKSYDLYMKAVEVFN